MNDVCSVSDNRSLKFAKRKRLLFSICLIPDSRIFSESSESALKTFSSIDESRPRSRTISAKRSAFSRRLISPSVHADIISGSTIKRAGEFAEDSSYIVTVGITPDAPETGYGYIKMGEPKVTPALPSTFEQSGSILTTNALLLLRWYL